MFGLTGKNKTVAQTVGTVIIFGGLAWASVPFYDWFCRVTGFGGAVDRAETVPDDILEQTIKVRFDGSLERDMPWSFKPVVREMEIRIGETGLAFYEAYNPTDKPIAGSASYNITPYDAGGFFYKVQCFCFEEQVLEPGERIEMPVTFYVDPEIVNDREGQYVHTITLSYTFHQIDLPEDYSSPEEQAALTVDTETTLN